MDSEWLNSICAVVASWLKRAGEKDKTLVLESLQIRVTATVDETRVYGVLPTELPSTVNSGIPFHHSLPLG